MNISAISCDTFFITVHAGVESLLLCLQLVFGGINGVHSSMYKKDLHRQFGFKYFSLQKQAKKEPSTRVGVWF